MILNPAAGEVGKDKILYDEREWRAGRNSLVVASLICVNTTKLSVIDPSSSLNLSFSNEDCVAILH
jgi:hypothetical protein